MNLTRRSRMAATLVVTLSCLVQSIFLSASALGDEQLLDGIWESWEQREARFKTVEIHWKERMFRTESGLEKITERSFLLAPDGLARYTRKGPTWTDGRYVDRTFWSLSNKSVSAQLYAMPVNPRSGDYPIGFLNDSQSMWEDNIRYYFPIRDTFRPTENIARNALKMESRSTDSDGISCVVVSFGRTQLYLDPVREYLCVRHVTFSGGHPMTDMSIKYEGVEGGYVPRAWFTRGYLGGNLSVKSTAVVQSVQINDALDMSIFEPDFPVATLVSERISGKKPLMYLKRPKGEKRIVKSEERRTGIHYEKYLNTESGEVLDEKPRQLRFQHNVR